MASTVKQPKRFQGIALNIAFATALACIICGLAMLSPSTAFAEEDGGSLDGFSAPAVEDIAPAIEGDATALEDWSSKDVYLEPGQSYNVGSSGHLGTHVRITKPGTYTLSGSSMITTVHITTGGVTVYLEDGLNINPWMFANGTSPASAITVAASSGDVRLVSKTNATVKLNGYLTAPSIHKAGAGCRLYFQTENEDKPGHIICDRTSYKAISGSAVAIGTMDSVWNTASNIIFQSGRVTAKGANSAAGIGNAVYSNNTRNVTGITFEGTADVTAVGGGWGAPGIGSVNGDTTDIVIKGNAKVTATGSEGSPGIGSGTKDNPCSDAKVSVRIEGGQVTAKGGSGAPGIGSLEGSADIKISGGTVTAQGQSGNPGIGSGQYCSNKTNIEITGGLVVVTGGQEKKPAIGTASASCAVNVKISGGTVDVKPGVIGMPENSGGYPAGSKVTIDGGTVQTGSMAIYPSAVNSNGERVYPATIKLEGKTEGSVSSLTVKNLKGYTFGTKDIRLRSDHLYLWLPNGGAVESAVDAEGNCYVGTVIVNDSSTQGTLYLGSNVILDGGSMSLTYGTARISRSGTILSDVVEPTLDGYTVSSYRSPDRLIPVIDGATHRVVSGDDKYVDGNSGTWIYSGSYPVRLVASWKPISYNIKFDSNVPDDTSNEATGSMPNQNNLTFGEETSLLKNQFVLNGYKFVGWNTEPDGSGDGFEDGGAIDGRGVVEGTDSGPYTLYAQWEPLEYDVTFVSGTGTTDTSYTQTLTYDQEKKLDAVRFENPGYYFAGWTSSDSKTYVDGATVENLCTFGTDGTPIGLTLTAQWATDDHVSIVITLDNGPVEINNPEQNIKLQPTNGTTGAAITGFEKVAEGIYECDNVPSGTYGIDFDPEAAEYNTSGITVTHKEGTFTSVSLEYCTATINNVEDERVRAYLGYPTPSGNSSVTVLKGTKVTLWAEAVSKSGYAFGEYTCVGVKPEGLDASSEEEQTITINGKVEITPHARPVNYTVKLDANKPSGSSSAMYGEMEPMSMTYDEAKTIPKNKFRLTGYSFDGWNTQADGNGTTYSDEHELENLTTEDGKTVTLYAKWKVHEYIISFDRNVPKNASTGDEDDRGNTPNMNDLAYDQEHKLTENGFKLPGYEFIGWNTSPDGTGTYFADEEYVRNLTAENNVRVVLYAQWRPLTYTIKFDAGDGSGTMKDFVVAFDETVQLPLCTFSREGYAFSHWSGAGLGSSYIDGASIKNLCGIPAEPGKLETVTLTANWTDESETTVIVRRDGGPITGLEQSDVTLKTFDGTTTFYAQSGGGEQFVFTGLPDDGYYVIQINGYDTGQTLVKRGETVMLDYYSVTIEPDSPNSDNANIATVWIGSKDTGAKTACVLSGTTVPIGATAKTGYVFDHYNASGVDPTWDPSIAEQDIVINGTVKITASARGATYTVHFDPNVPEGASTAAQFKGTMNDQTLTYGHSSKLHERTFSLPGYTFSKWNTKPDGEGVSIDENTSPDDSDFAAEDGETVVLYAIWTPRKYEVKFKSTEDSTSDENKAKVYEFDQQLTVPSPSDLGMSAPSDKTFIGWTTGALGNCYLAEETAVNICSLNSDGGPEGMTLTAIWAEDSTTTIFVTDDDVLSSRFTAEDIALCQGETMYSGASGSNGAFTFSDGNASGSGTTPSSLPGGEFDIYADGVDTGIDVSKGGVAKVPYCTVEIIGDLHAEAWFYDPENNEPISDPTLVVVGSEIGITTEVDQGYRFESYTAIGIQPKWSSEQANQTVTINGKALIEAHSVNNVYTVTFDANGGTGTMEPQDMVYGEPQNLFANAFSRTGYTFIGWNTEADGTGTKYSDGERVSNLAATDQGVVLYAQWSRIPSPTPPANDVGLDTTGHGDVSTSPQNAKPGETVTVVAQPDEGYGVFSIEVLDSAGNQIPLTDNGDGTYSFEMPKDDVTVETMFKVILPFSDLDWHHWGYDDIALAYERGLIVGYDSGLFGADDVTTRAMAVTVIWRFAGCPQSSSDMPFSDVAEDQWYTEAIRWAAETGIAAGYEGTGLFGPEDALTREQVVALLMRYAETENMDTTDRADLSSFPDGDAASDWAKDAIEWAVAEGLLFGYSDTGILDPQGGGTRAALAALTMRYDTMLPVGPVS